MEPATFRRAFDVHQALLAGWEALRRAAVPLWVGALLITCTEQGGSFIQAPPIEDSEPTVQEPISAALLAPFGTERGIDPRSGDDGPASTLPWGRSSDGGESTAEGFLTALTLGMLLCGLVLVFVLFLANCWLQPGWIRLQVQALRGAGDRIEPLFSGSDRFVPILVTRLLHGLIVLVAAVGVGLPGLAVVLFMPDNVWRVAGIAATAIPAVLVGTYVNLGFSLCQHLVILNDQSPVESLRTSWSVMRGNRLYLLLFAAIMAILEAWGLFVGSLACCVGALVTWPAARAVTHVAFTRAYLQLYPPA